MKIKFVTFYADGGKAKPVISGDLDGPSQIDLLVKSAQQIHPATRFTVLTDEFTDLTSLPNEVSIKRHPIDLSQIMLERMRAQREFLMSGDFDSPTVFVDTDVLISGDLTDLFLDDFDIAFTWRKSDEMPLNGGVIYVNDKRPENSVRLFSRLFDIYVEKYTGTSAWYGDQFAMLNLINLPFDSIYESPTVERHEGKIKLLDCATYNYSPNGERPDLGGFPSGIKVFHFKGMSRRIMEPTWLLHLSADRPSGLRKKLAISYQNLRLRALRRNYRTKLRKDLKRFNCGEQNDAAWIDRAEIAAQLASIVVSDNGKEVTVADVGCGNQKLKAALSRLSLNVAYQGYDLVPQSESVTKMDINTDSIARCDIAFVLGVLEYSGDISKPLQMLAHNAQYLVVSHAVSDFRKMSASSLRRLNWKTHMSQKDFEETLRGNGFQIRETRMTANQRSVVWLCEVKYLAS
ncbi:hypothetical protein G6L28_09955 [Agrobacterium larrymoorei]|uniref:hypothetical protein n=1 Tax=Agrobacterium larrymoorei TaxID=160699 RepID=UPI0015718696|nr:hypothetical protein [Agrobacterium larrymoorei]NTJ42916.1 hypothetical protein [Agrobacterium larrymoorei]